MLEHFKTKLRQEERGQALVEYALILTLVAIALAAAVAATGPAIGNVFSNVVCNLVEQQQSCATNRVDLAQRGGPTAFWLTITAVATNPPQDRTFPTNVPVPATSSPTPGPSPTPTPITPSPTPSFTPTLPPTSTPTDIAHDAPFYDPIDKQEWWRVDSSVYLGGQDWIGKYYPGRNLSSGGSVAPDATMPNNLLAPRGTYDYNIAFDWGTSGPTGTAALTPTWLIDNFSIEWTRNVYVFGSTNQTFSINIRVDGGVRFYVDGALNSALNDWSGGRTFDSGTLNSTITLTPGAHTFKVEYFENTGPAGIFVNIVPNSKRNVRDDSALPSGTPNCLWTRISGTQANSVTWTWKESIDPNSAGFPSNMRCHLELRGYVDVSTLTSATMSFWDVWDLGANTTVRLQMAEYAPYSYSDSGTPSDPTDDVVTPGSGPNWTQFPATTLHSGTTKNYAWVRNQIAIPSVPSGKITYRFVIESNGSSGTRRWYVDDIRLDNAVASPDIGHCTNKATCTSFWDMENTAQQNAFITSGRWAMVSGNTANNSAMSWAVSGSNNTNNNSLTNYVNFGPEQSSPSAAPGVVERIHAIEFNNWLNFSSIDSAGNGGQPDWNGNDGYPQLNFYHAYNLEAGESLVVQYTRDARDTTDDTWTNIYTILGPLASASNNLAMSSVTVPLNSIPNWNTQHFRLRLALLVNAGSPTTAGSGWWIDDIILERKGVPRFSNYPFCDNAEGVYDPSASGGFRTRGLEQWLVSGQWGLATVSKGNGARSFTDSPAGNYLHGLQTSMTLKYTFDLNNDTPENLTQWGGNKGEFYDGVNCSVSTGSRATRPILSFWQWRKLAANESVAIDISRSANATSGTTAILPTAIWTYSYNSRTQNQVAWELVEIDLDAAIKAVTGFTLAQLSANADPRDDDFYIAVRLNSTSDPSVSDGVYVDNISLKEYSETSHKLWNTSTSITPLPGAPAAGSGNGPRFIDDIDSPSDWYNRWQTGGTWDAGNAATVDWAAHSGIFAFTDSPLSGVTYLADQFSVLEMNKIIDLRGATTNDNPTLYFWDRYNVGSNGRIQVQIAVQDQYEMTGTAPATAAMKRNRQGYDYLYDWGSATSYSSNTSWETPAIWSRGSLSQVNTWVREQIDLRAYADNPGTAVNEGKRIKIRFVLDTLDVSSSLRDGWYIDDIRIEFRNPRLYTIPFFDGAQNTLNWVTEGIWGLAPDYFRGSGGGPASFGPNKYNAYYFDCIQWMANPTRNPPQSGDLNQVACTTSNVNTFFNSPAIGRTDAATNAWIAARPTYPVLKESVDLVNNDFGSTGRPFGAPLGLPGATWDDHYMGRWMRDITVVTGDYTFITTSDDAVRLRYETSPAGGAPAGWNIINNWTSHSRKVDIQNVHLDAGNYQLVMEWFEGSGNAVIILQAGNNNFSFSDSPKPTSVSAPVLSVAYGNSSLMLDGLLSLQPPPTGVFIPRLQFFTYYELGASASANVEVSIDGGFSWNQSNLSNNCPVGLPSSQCNPTINGTSSWLPSNDWMARSHDLRSYNTRNIGLRFRLNTQSDVRDGWWITDIEVNS